MVDQIYSSSPLCRMQRKEFYADWVIYARVAHFGCFSAIILFILLKLSFSKKPSEHTSVYGSALTIVCVAYASNFLSLCCEWGGICKDAFG